MRDGKEVKNSVTNELNEREYVTITDNKLYHYLISKINTKQAFYIKLENCISHIPVYLEFHEENMVTISSKDDLPDKLTLYSYSPRYIDLLVEKLSNNQNKDYKILQFHIANNSRKNNRVNIENLGITLSNISLDYCCQFNQMDSMNHSMFKNLSESASRLLLQDKKIHFHPYDPLSPDINIQAVNREMKAIFIEDVQSGRCYTKHRCLNLEDLSYINFFKYLDKLKSRNIQSIITIPVIYKNIYNDSIIIGYLEKISQTKSLNLNNFNELLLYKKQLLDIITNYYRFTINSRWRVLNVSEKGLLVESNEGEDLFSNATGPLIQFKVPHYGIGKITLIGKIRAINSNCDRKSKFLSILLDERRSLDIEKWKEFISVLQS